jgi:hypothetical protein
MLYLILIAKSNQIGNNGRDMEHALDDMSVENFRLRCHLGELGNHWRIVLEWVLEKWGVRL